MVKSKVQIKNGIEINDNVSAKVWEKIMCLKKIIFGILVYVLVKLVNL